jgi:hypothetical protein
MFDIAAERVAVQLPQARRQIVSKPNDLVREAVGWNGGLGRICKAAAVAKI